jgi:hypothetical protein
LQNILKKKILSWILFFKIKFTKNHHSYLQHGRVLRCFYFYILNITKFGKISWWDDSHLSNITKLKKTTWKEDFNHCII